MPSRRILALCSSSLLAACAPNSGPAGRAASSEPASLRFRVGEASVLAMRDSADPYPIARFDGLPPERIVELLRAGGEYTTDPNGGPAWEGATWAFLVEVGGRRVLVDTGLGRIAARLDAAGIAPGTIDAIVISHMHTDHVGGLLDAQGSPLYGRATLHLHADEAAFWGDPARGSAAPPERRELYDTARAVLAAYGDRVRLHRGPTTIVPGLVSEPLVGHTPGHSVQRLSSAGAEMVFIGDMIHSLAIQMPELDVTWTGDEDAPLARAARRDFLAANVRSGVRFAGPHFRSGVVTIERAGAGYRATPARP